jgi:hypothetical protein
MAYDREMMAAHERTCARWKSEHDAWRAAARPGRLNPTAEKAQASLRVDLRRLALSGLGIPRSGITPSVLESDRLRFSYRDIIRGKS